VEDVCLLLILSTRGDSTRLVLLSCAIYICVSVNGFGDSVLSVLFHFCWVLSQAFVTGDAEMPQVTGSCLINICHIKQPPCVTFASSVLSNDGGSQLNTSSQAVANTRQWPDVKSDFFVFTVHVNLLEIGKYNLCELSVLWMQRLSVT